MNDDRENTVLANLPSGVWLVSALIADQSPPRHVYRVIGSDGAVLSEHATLIALIEHLDDDTERLLDTWHLPGDHRPSRRDIRTR
jgi:hypothetical protein